MAIITPIKPDVSLKETLNAVWGGDFKIKTKWCDKIIIKGGIVCIHL